MKMIEPLNFDMDYLISDYLKDLLFILNESGEYLYVNNKAHLEQLGLKQEELIGQSVFDFIHENDQRKMDDLIQGVFKDVENSIEIKFKKEKRKYSWYELKGKKFIDKRGNIRALFIGRRIQKYKKIEKEKKDIESRFQELMENFPELRFWKILYPQSCLSAVDKAREMLEYVIDNIPQFIAWKDEDFEYIGCNPEYAKILNLNSPEKVSGLKDDHFNWSKKTLKEIRELETKVLEERTTVRQQQKKLTLPNGYEGWFDINRIPLENSKSKKVGLLISLNDITRRIENEKEIKQSREKLRKMNKILEERVNKKTKKLQQSQEDLRKKNLELQKKNKELRRLDKVKNDFISMAGHALKTPLVSIAGYTDFILTKHQNLEEEIKEDLEAVYRNVKRLEEYIDQLLDVIKIDAKQMEVDLFLQENNIFEIVDECLAEVEFQVKKKNLKVENHINKDLSLSIDKKKISQVFSNLISNSIKFTPEGGKISMSSKFENHKCLFQIKDTGIGLTEEEISRLFGKFVKLRESVNNFSMNKSIFKSGSGLGLYITKGIIEAHGGEIWAESDGKNKGSIFYFSLPKER